MAAFVSWLRSRWPLLAFLASAAILAAAHGFERFGGLAPCPLCLDQREWHWGVLGVSAACFVLSRVRPGLERWAAAAIGVVYFGALWAAAHHVAVEQHWIIATCDADIDLNEITPLDFSGAFDVPRCDTPAWTLFGLSMAAYNALLCLGLAILSVLAVLTPAKVKS